MKHAEQWHSHPADHVAPFTGAWIETSKVRAEHLPTSYEDSGVKGNRWRRCSTYSIIPLFDRDGHPFVPTCLVAGRRAQRRGRGIGGRPGCGERMRSPKLVGCPVAVAHACDAALTSARSLFPGVSTLASWRHSSGEEHFVREDATLDCRLHAGGPKTEVSHDAHQPRIRRLLAEPDHDARYPCGREGPEGKSNLEKRCLATNHGQYRYACPPGSGSAPGRNLLRSVFVTRGSELWWHGAPLAWLVPAAYAVLRRIPCGISPVVTSFHSRTSNLRARATIMTLRTRAPLAAPWVRSWNQRDKE